MHSHALTLRELQRQDILSEADHARCVKQHLPGDPHSMRKLLRRLMVTRAIGLTTVAALGLPRRLVVQR
jgi:hypothetical protein